MTINEMKLAVCEKLPEKILVSKDESEWLALRWIVPGGFTKGINWPTEGLQVCREAEKMLDKRQQIEYVKTLWTNSEAEWKHGCNREIHSVCATYEQRLEALCRVWFPERFV